MRAADCNRLESELSLEDRLSLRRTEFGRPDGALPFRAVGHPPL